jgi:hypothetical protein
MTIYTGDILLKKNEYGDWDMNWQNGQPDMTNGLETYVFLAVFGENYWGNALEKSDSAKMKSEFPGIIKRNVVSDQTKNDGTKALEKALAPAIVEKIARKITVTGEIQTSFRIAWLIEIEAIKDKGIKYYINWEKGELTANLFRG